MNICRAVPGSQRVLPRIPPHSSNFHLDGGTGVCPVEAEWVRELRDQCDTQRVAFFFKQWGGRTPKAGGNTLDGRQWMEYPGIEGRRNIKLNSASGLCTGRR